MLANTNLTTKVEVGHYYLGNSIGPNLGMLPNDN